LATRRQGYAREELAQELTPSPTTEPSPAPPGRVPAVDPLIAPPASDRAVGVPRQSPHLRRHAGERCVHLPAHYHTDRVVLLARDPWWLFTYWESAALSARWAEKAAQGAQVVLRLHDAVQGTCEDIAVDSPHGNYYIQAGRPGHTFYLELGLRQGGAFAVFARSAPVVAPRGGPSGIRGNEWATRDELRRRRRLRTGSEAGPPEGRALAPSSPGPWLGAVAFSPAGAWGAPREPR